MHTNSPENNSGFGRVTAVALAALCLASCTPPAAHFVLDDPPACTQAQIDEWIFINGPSEGVDGRDLRGDVVGDLVSGRVDSLFPLQQRVRTIYSPFSPVKETLCGTLERFNFFDPTWGGPEADWNNFLIPKPAFAALLDGPIASGSSEIQDCPKGSGLDNCLEAEITVDQAFYDNPWFPKGPGDEGASSFLEGSVICAYGPWVADHGHSRRPEIHPSELIWTRMPWPGGHVFVLFMLQEDSNRFDRVRQRGWGYANPPSIAPISTAPSGWRPWSDVPRTAEFRLAFEVVPGEERAEFGIHELDSARVRTASFPEFAADADAGSEHALVVDGETVVEVVELGQDEHLGVTFDNVCRMQPNRLLGYVALRAAVGDDDDGGEGFLNLAVARAVVELGGGGRVDIRDFQAPPFSEAIELSFDRDSLALTGKELVGTFQLRLPVATAQPTSDLMPKAVDWVLGESRRAIELKLLTTAAKGEPNTWRLANVPVMAGGSLQIRTGSGNVVERRLVRHSALATLSVDAPKEKLDGGAEAWADLLEHLGAGEARAPGRFLRLERATVTADLSYAAVRGDLPSTDEDSLLREILSEAIEEGDKRRLTELFGTVEPLAVGWAFTARSLTGGYAVEVVVDGEASPTAVRIDTTIAGNRALATVTFPTGLAEHLVEVTAVAEARGVFGSASSNEIRVWNHTVEGQASSAGAEALLAVAASMAELSPARLAIDAHLGVGPYNFAQRRDPVLRSARMAHLLALGAITDGQVDVAELESILGAARYYAESSHLQSLE